MDSVFLFMLALPLAAGKKAKASEVIDDVSSLSTPDAFAALVVTAIVLLVVSKMLEKSSLDEVPRISFLYIAKMLECFQYGFVYCIFAVRETIIPRPSFVENHHCDGVASPLRGVKWSGRAGASAACFIAITDHPPCAFIFIATTGHPPCACRCVIQAMMGNICDRVFPSFSPSHAYAWPRLLLEVAAQAGANAMLAQLTRDIVSQLPLPDLDGDDKALPAAGGGVIFAFVMFSRQGQWKLKVAALDQLLEKHFYFVLPKSLLALVGV